MSEGQITKLDILCAELGRCLAAIKDEEGKPVEEKVFNEALTVLEEQGPYAMFLYLHARHGNFANEISRQVLDFLKDSNAFGHKVDGTDDIFDAVKRLAGDLDDLLFACDLLRTALSYARYHLKAKGGSAS